MKLSVITVCYNAEKEIAKTIESVLSQRFTDMEYVVVDGGSSDRTNDIAESYRDAFEHKGIDLIHVSEPDHGIYDAMNKGAGIARGEWLSFMNAGDEFYNDEVLSEVFGKDTYEGYDVIYGDVNKRSGKYSKIGKAGEPERIPRCMQFCHQSSFTRRTVMLEEPFDLQYRICADYNFFLKLFLYSHKFRKLDMVIASFDNDGLCNTDLYGHYSELYSVQAKYGLVDLNSKEILTRLKKVKAREKLKKILPQKIVNYIRFK